MAEQAEPNCVWDNKVKFCQIANEWFVGTNSSNQKANAVESTDDIQGLLIIPSEVNGHQITQIGQYAFFECRLITRLIIKARITSIHYRGFSHCDKIEYVYLPNTLQYLFFAAIDLCGQEIIDDKVTYFPSKGITYVVFEENTNLKYIGQAGLGWREVFVVIHSNTIDPILDEKAFINVSLIYYKSPNGNVKFCNQYESELITNELYQFYLGKKHNSIDLSCVNHNSLFLYTICSLI